jgi:hypothetical protein
MIMSNSCTSNLRLHKKQLIQLLLATPVIKYSDWKPEQINSTYDLSLKAGVYHFFEKLENGDIKSIYVGKASFSIPNQTYKNGWSLYERLKQHFQVKGDGMLKKYLGYGYESSSSMKNDFNNRQVYLQWLPLYHKTPSETLDSATCEMQNREITFCEHFCVSLLHPEFNDG